MVPTSFYGYSIWNHPGEASQCYKMTNTKCDRKTDTIVITTSSSINCITLLYLNTILLAGMGSASTHYKEMHLENHSYLVTVSISNSCFCLMNKIPIVGKCWKGCEIILKLTFPLPSHFSNTRSVLHRQFFSIIGERIKKVLQQKKLCEQCYQLNFCNFTISSIDIPWNCAKENNEETSFSRNFHQNSVKLTFSNFTKELYCKSIWRKIFTVGENFRNFHTVEGEF